VLARLPDALANAIERDVEVGGRQLVDIITAADPEFAIAR
jgi:hypothetical protein